MMTEVRNRIQSSRLASVSVSLLLALFVSSGCGDSDDEGTGPEGPFRLTFQLDASFQGAHGGQSIAIALVRSSDSSVIVQANGAVSATEDPSFIWEAGAVMDAGIDYEVHYWIDSNFGGGTSGVCDPKAIDHQWSAEFLSVSNDITWTTAHEPGLTEDVCPTFS